MKNKKRGFTIVELVVVIAVIGILAAVLIPTFSNITEKAEKSAALQEASSALTVVLTEENGQLETSEFDYYFFSGDYVYKYVDGKLAALTKSEMTALNVVVATSDEVYTKAGHKWIGDKGINRDTYTESEETYIVYTVGVAKDSANNTISDVNSTNVSAVVNKITVHEIAEMGGVVVWKDAK